MIEFDTELISKARYDELKFKVKRQCESQFKNRSAYLCLQTSLVSFNNKEKIVFFKLLTEELNSKYPFVTSIDLTWNALEAQDLFPLAELKHVKDIDLDLNNIDGGEPEGAKALALLEKNISYISCYDSSKKFMRR